MRKRRRSRAKKPKKARRNRTRDDRFPKVFGALFLLCSAYLAVACISYLFTWQIDQDKVLHFSWSVLSDGDLHVANWLGRLGAIVSHGLFYWGFGLPSLLLVLLLGKFGLNLLQREPMNKFYSLFRQSFLLIVFLSLAMEFFFQRSGFSWGGAFGESTSIWLSNFLGDVGLFLLLVFSATVAIIWRFNPDFRYLHLPFKGKLPSIRIPFKIPRFAFSSRSAGSEQGENTSEGNEGSEDGSSSFSHTLQPTFLSKYKDGGIVEDEDEDEDSEEENNAVDLKVPVTNTKNPKSDSVDTELEIMESSGDEDENGQSTNVNLIGQHQPNPFPQLQEEDDDTPYDPTLELSSYKFPELDLLNEYKDMKVEIDRAELEANKDQIIETLLNYKIEITKIRATIGPTVTLYEIVPAAGVRISRIKNLEDDIALSLSALGIRIIAPIPGKGTIGIEVPNKNKQIVSLREVLRADKYQNAKMDLPIALGKTIANEIFVADLARMPHLLIAGATGQGKSVGINAIITSLLYSKHPSQIKFVLIDPKKVELFPYSKLENHFLAFQPDQEEPIVTETKSVVATLNSLCIEMDERYNLLKAAHARNIKEYNQKFVDRKLNPKKGHRFMPFIVLVIDEFADLIMTAGKEIELPIGRLAQLARAVGIHLIIATQRPSVNIITGVIKANFPVRLAYKVSSKVDSRTILDTGGAEQLIGHGDMLLSLGSNLIRLQCAFIDTPEVEEVIDFIADQRGYPEPFYLPEYKSEDDPIAGTDGLKYSDLDEMFEDAARLIVQNQHGSTSMIQRRLKLGYNRAGRIMDQLEAMGIVGPNEGSKAREVLVMSEMELENFFEELRSRV